ncbi:MAG TPA: hypothetical protein VE650_00270 [Acetobacteraceae bacterium]|jgi:hypothetical protein|nr:hypothetical protein [Acetobacteraceae bacterium]
MSDSKASPNPQQAAEKLATQAETGEGRSMARPGGAGIGSDMGSIGAPGGSLSGNVTNDSMPEGGATGDRAQPDTVKPERS